MKRDSARAYFMCENPAVVCHLMPCVFEMDGALRAEQQGALESCHGAGRVRRASEVDERDGARVAAVAAVAAAQQPQPREPGAAVTTILSCCAHTRTPVLICVSLILVVLS